MYTYHKALVMALAESLAWTTEEYSTEDSELGHSMTVSRCHLNVMGALIVIDHCSNNQMWSWSIHSMEVTEPLPSHIFRPSGQSSSLWNAKCSSLHEVIKLMTSKVSLDENEWTMDLSRKY